MLAATASSRSPHVLRVLDGGIDPTPYVVMEFIDGTDLGRELERRRRIPQLETIRIGRAVADALSALESVGIIHRDIKPANVMVDVDGVVKLTDFGIAKIVGFDSITATSQMPMSMAYAAPEAWEGQASHQSDLYSLGCLLFQCLAGRPPFTGSPAQLFREHTTKDPDWTLLPEGTVQSLRDLLRACLAKDPGGRPRDSASVAEQLAEAERELNARVVGSTDSNLPVHEPQAFGPWLRREKHLIQPWAFLCIHETTGEKATVEIHFADDIEYGSRLRKAVEVNPKLVPLGAERLLGTNRLVLRPGEAWTNPPVGQFAFWVAREELPVRPGPEAVGEATLGRAASNLVALTNAAASEGLELRLPPESLHLLNDGTVWATRAGLATTGDDGTNWLRSLRPDGDARTSMADAQDLNELVHGHTVKAGVASAAADDGTSGETGFETTLRGDGLGSSSTSHEPAPMPPDVKATSEPAPGPLESRPLALEAGPPTGRRRRVALWTGGGAALVIALAAASMPLGGTTPPTACADGSVASEIGDCATVTPTPAPATSTSIPPAGTRIPATPTPTPTTPAPIPTTPTPTSTSPAPTPTTPAPTPPTSTPVTPPTSTPTPTPTTTPTIEQPANEFSIIDWQVDSSDVTTVTVTFSYLDVHNSTSYVYLNLGVQLNPGFQEVSSQAFPLVPGRNSITFDFSHRTFMYCANAGIERIGFLRLQVHTLVDKAEQLRQVYEFVDVPWGCGSGIGAGVVNSAS